MIAVSIVSHGHGAMVSRLVEQVLACPEVGQVIVTYNVPETFLVSTDERIEVIVNPLVRGFGANHNAAFLRIREPFWCVLNPDVELVENPFPVLLAALTNDSVALAAPLIINSLGEVEDSIRYFPTPISLASKFLGKDSSRYAVSAGAPDFSPEWVAGMFMLFQAHAFSGLKGFDERYFLYYEDVDICWRAWQAGFSVVACPAVAAIHHAQRASRVSWQHRRWHLASMLRFLSNSLWRRPRLAQLDGL
ncbi:MAG: glycosyltransferase family protein [Proteobacteria bacterium]|nr:glycosyltransferase family protein [Pseudomonadota bacterium]